MGTALISSALDSIETAPRTGRPLLRRLTAIAFLDVVGYSHLMGLDEESTLREWLALQHMVIEPCARAWRGRIANRAGDGLFLEFRSALDAFRWAAEVQEAIASRNFADVTLRVRIALHLGDVIDDGDGEVLGDGVNTAARLQSFAEPGGIVVSQAIANEVGGKTAAVFRDLGSLHLKNISRPVRAFHIHAPADGSPAKPSEGQPTVRSSRFRMWSSGLARTATTLAMLFFPLAQYPSPNTFAAASPRQEAMRLFDEGRAVACPGHPCAREWLASRSLYEQAIAKDPTYAPPYAYASLVDTNLIANDLSLDEAADLRSAETLATRATALAPGAAVVYTARAAVLAMQPDRLEDALSAYQRSLAIDPDQPPIRGNVGWMLLLLGRPAEAERFLDQALAEAPGHVFAPAWLTYLGLAELFQDHEGHGAAQFRRAIAQQSPAAAEGEIGVQRSIDLAAALALDGALDEARQIVDALRRQNPTLSTRSSWNCDCSRATGYRTGVETLKRGVVLAGLPDIP